MTAPDPVRAGKALGGAAAAILLLEGIAVLFVPRGIAQSGPGLTGGRLTFLIVLAVLLVLASGLQRRPRGLLPVHPGAAVPPCRWMRVLPLRTGGCSPPSRP